MANESHDGVVPLGDYDKTTAGEAIDVLIALIPDPDTVSTSGAIAEQGGMFDEMMPHVATELRVELLAMKAQIGAYEAP